MITTPKRRWFAYSLRTLFVVVTVFGVWLGWNLKAVHDRQELNRQLEASGAEFFYTSGVGGNIQMVQDGNPLTEVSAVRHFLGDKNVFGIFIPHKNLTPWESEAIRYFPEAWVCTY